MSKSNLRGQGFKKGMWKHKRTLSYNVCMQTGDIAVMRKPHACGSTEWEIVRVGADVGLKCLKCGHKVMLERAYFNKRVKEIITKEQ
ncbi:MAG: DUF951 domain-containing protein [Armatimonadota bacterium]|nr:DUF951 domain-containing protein [bacterium]